MRGKHVATALLERVIQDATKEGYDYTIENSYLRNMVRVFLFSGRYKKLFKIYYRN